jgi:mevalonate kinase
MITASATGKVILLGEHAVVYGQPAIAVPVTQVATTAAIQPFSHGIQIEAPGIHLSAALTDLNTDHPIKKAVAGFLAFAGITSNPSFKVTITSTIPIASGLGSGAAVSIALLRALAGYFQVEMSAEQVNALAFEVEKIHHGTPSGIDNTVIAFSRPVYYIKDTLLETFTVRQPFHILIADTGVSAPTRLAVSDVRKLVEADPEFYGGVIEQIGEIVKLARGCIETGAIRELGDLMTLNQGLLADLTVSSPELDTLIGAAMRSGALGAKLSGGGRGGNCIALVEDSLLDSVRAALFQAGAKNVTLTRIS